jgi:hypothetical protein
VKHLSEKFTDDEYERLKAGKGDRSWRDALLEDVAEPPEGDG